MTKVLLAGVLSVLLVILPGAKVIGLLRRLRVGQNIREELQQGHQVKAGTPTMGGLMIVVATTLPFLALSGYGKKSLAVLGAILGCAAIGLLDDWQKVVRKRSLGLRGRYKIIGQLLVSAGLCLVANAQDVTTRIFLPLLDLHVDLGPVWYLLVFLIVVGASNAVNLTDGLDGLAAGTTSIAVLAYTAMTVIAYQVSVRDRVPNAETLDLAILAAALLGACVGFLWFNAFPAQVFMGDTGSLALGGAVAGFAVFTKTELLLPLIGGVFVIEALSVIIQVFWFKRTGRRPFRMAPIHHHFEMLAWSETKIMVRFWIVATMFAAVGFVLYYLRFDQYA